MSPPEDVLEEGCDVKLGFSLVDLETFIAIADTGNFSLAAERLGVSQPTVTARIKKLEDSFGVQLFSRTTRRIHTTPAGERLHNHSKALLIQLGRLQEELRGEGSLSSGTLSIGAPPVLASILLPPMVAEFSTRYPNISVRIHEERRKQALSGLSSGLLDLVLIGEGEVTREFDFEPMFATEYYVIGPLGHAIANLSVVGFEELARHRLVMMPLDESVWQAVAEQFEKRGLELRRSFEATGMFTMLQMVEAGIGLTILPSIALPALDPSRHVAVKLATAGELSRRVGFMFLRGRELSPSAKMFRQSARTWIRGQINSGRGTYLTVPPATVLA